MSSGSAAQYGLFLLILVLLIRPVGGYLARVFSGERAGLDPLLRPVERSSTPWPGSTRWSRWTGNTTPGAFLAFGLGGTVLLYVLLRLQPLVHTFDPVYRPGPLSPTSP